MLRQRTAWKLPYTPPPTRTRDDNAGTGLTWSLSGADASKFDITTNGDMRTLSFENATRISNLPETRAGITYMQ